jgi:hypothetical protein
MDHGDLSASSEGGDRMWRHFQSVSLVGFVMLGFWMKGAMDRAEARMVRVKYRIV